MVSTSAGCEFIYFQTFDNQMKSIDISYEIYVYILHIFIFCGKLLLILNCCRKSITFTETYLLMLHFYASLIVPNFHAAVFT